jgi:hypothetical protein
MMRLRNKAKRNKTKQNKTKQNKTKQNKTKQNKKHGDVLRAEMKSSRSASAAHCGSV